MGRKTGRILGVLVLALGLSVLGLAQTKTLTILHTNDTHSALLPFTHQPYPTPFTWLLPDCRQGWADEFRGPGGFNREYAGIARMSTLIKNIRRNKRNVLALHAGDVFVGSFEFNKYLGYPELKIMENLYDAMALGNHEFDLGLGALAWVVSGAPAGNPPNPVTLPLLCSNFAFTDPNNANDPGNLLATIIKDSIVRTVDGIKVGIFGLGNEDPINYTPDVAERFGPEGHAVEVAKAQATALKGVGCQVVICLSHLGTASDIEKLSKVNGIDIIVGGHSHELFDKAVIRNGKIIVQVGSHGRYLGELQVKVDAGGGVKLLKWQAHEVDKTVKPDPSLKAQLDAIRAGVVQDERYKDFGDVYADPVAYAFRNIEHDWPARGQFRDAPLGNLVADSIYKALTAAHYPVDCVLDALGYTEFGIPAGKVVGNDIMRAVPYGYDETSGLGFKLVVAILPPNLIAAGLEFSVSTAGLNLQTSGLTFAYDSSKPPAEQLGQISRLDVTSVKIGTEYIAPYLLDPTLDPNKFYYVGMTDQVYNFLNGLVGGGLPKLDPNPPIFEYNAVRDYMKSLGFVYYKSEGRVLDKAPASTTVRKR